MAGFGKVKCVIKKSEIISFFSTFQPIIRNIFEVVLLNWCLLRLILVSSTGNPNTLSAISLVSNKNKCTVIYLCPCVIFESFKRDLNEAKAVSFNVVNYLLLLVNISHLPLCNYDAPITSQVWSNVVNY